MFKKELNCPHNKKQVKPQDGFTLVEMLFVLIIYGIIIAMLLNGWRLYTDTLRDDRTIANIQLATNGIGSFANRISPNRYPCPADPALGPNSPSYGLELCPGDAGFPGGIVQVWGRDINNDNAVDIRENVLIGAVPYRTLNLAFDFSADGIDQDGDGLDGEDSEFTTDGSHLPEAREILDGWGNKLTYAVTQGQTTTLQNNSFNGAIFLGDEFLQPAVPYNAISSIAALPVRGRSITQEEGRAHFVIVSHGQNGVGAFTEIGVQVAPCTLNPPATIPNPALVNETENCDGDAVFLSGLSDIRDDSFNDDIATFADQVYTTAWGYTPTSTSLVRAIHNLNSGNVGMGGITDPATRLHLRGNLSSNNAIAPQYCESGTGANCLIPEALGGNIPQMECPNLNEVVIEIRNNQVICAAPPQVPPPATGTQCNNDPLLGPVEAMVGITNLGNIVCEPI